MKLYQEWAWIWSEVTPEMTYAEEAQDLMAIITESLGRPPRNILELGSGGGYLLHDLQSQYPSVSVTLVDNSPQMLALAKERNPKAETILADMSTLNLSRQFDVVLLHDAVMYLADVPQVRQVLEVMNNHLSSDGVAVVLPDCCRETFEDRILTAETHTEKASLHLTEWHWGLTDEGQVSVEFSILLQDHQALPDQIQSHHETHRMLVLSLGEWMTLFMETGWMQDFPMSPWMHGGEFFLLRPMAQLPSTS